MYNGLPIASVNARNAPIAQATTVQSRPNMSFNNINVFGNIKPSLDAAHIKLMFRDGYDMV